MADKQITFNGFGIYVKRRESNYTQPTYDFCEVIYMLRCTLGKIMPSKKRCYYDLSLNQDFKLIEVMVEKSLTSNLMNGTHCMRFPP